MNENDFLARYRDEQPIFDAYCKYLERILHANILRSLKADESFFKIPITFRIKTEDSIIEKAFYRSKGYKDPYEQITDKIGGRVVVLLEEHTNGVCKVIESIEGFTFSKDKDFEKQRDENPELFLYQSHHYILRNTEKIFYAGIEVPVNTPAEIQIRTLLQHAYSELTHDTIYKPNTVASPEIKRYVAKSMALIEVTDSIFSKVHESLRYSEQLFSRIIDELNSLMPKEIMAKHDLKFNEHILDIFLTELDIYSFEGVRRFSQEYNFILEKINERSTYKYLYHQPVILFIYWLVSIKRKIVRAKWPLDFRDLEEIFIDLGYSFEKM